MNVNQILVPMELVLIKSMDILALVMLVTLMKTAQQVNNKIFVFLFQLCITENNCLNIIDCQRNTCVVEIVLIKSTDMFALLLLVIPKKKKKKLFHK